MEHFNSFRPEKQDTIEAANDNESLEALLVRELGESFDKANMNGGSTSEPEKVSDLKDRYQIMLRDNPSLREQVLQRQPKSAFEGELLKLAKEVDGIEQAKNLEQAA